ncbi:hypothetical protein GOB94_07750 [Granulicella sp. 5B5]|uniref:RDD family protein n=1 Tax=Granulicella sp. 5B5 TaxID=1617967 RepID=UPI001771DE69|nr:RDD family protein [Granulicella sp. 5B5]QMV18589.1 hypothetical protein GOB94_07750 [Granulicella sp. 5B5]
MENMLAKLNREPRHFHAHETARFDALSGLPLASFKQRMWAITIDVLAIFIVKGLLGLHNHHDDNEGPMTVARLLMDGAEYIKELVESTLYFAVAVKLSKGQTIGKWFMKVRIVSLTHDEMGWWQSIERALGYGASLLEGGFGFLQFFINRNRQTVHDRIAETIVIDERPTARRLGDVDHEEPEIEIEPKALEA